MASWQNELDCIIDANFDRTVEMRRQIHQNPEVSGEEFKTSMLLYQDLGDKGFQVRLGPEGRGVIADLEPPGNDDSNGIFAIRADIDALRIHDEKSVAYRSKCDGIMHACGHDGHTSLVNGAISAIAELHQSGTLPFRPRLRGVFQPAEETCEGANQMIECGALEGVDAIIATHLDPNRAVGKIGIREGVLTANCDHIKIQIEGRGGHAARPHEARDPIAAAAQFIQTLYMHIPRQTDSQDAVVVTIGMVQGGHTANVIPETMELQGTLRTLDSKIRDRTMKHIRRLADGVATVSRTEISVEFGLAANAVENDSGLTELIRESAASAMGPEGIEDIPRPSMGSEDFAFYGKHVPAAMFRLGCVSDQIGGSGLHTPTFDFDEEALRYGMKVIARSAISWMENQSKA